MARARSPEKRDAILEAAVREIAENGLGAPTAKIARRASIATGTLFTYFATKEDLLNELYLSLKQEVSQRIAADFPEKGDLESQLRHIWERYAEWAIDFPEKRKVTMQLGVSDVITPETRSRSLTNLAQTDAAFRELSRSAALRSLPGGFAGSLMTAFQQALIDTVEKEPARRDKLIRRAFDLYWRAVR